jgi:hypothetical protein
MDHESRAEHRPRTLKRGQVRIDGGKSLIDCTIRDLSETGAKLRFENVFPLPAQFDLFIVDANAVWPARNAWQKGAEAGVEFLPTEYHERAPDRF